MEDDNGSFSGEAVKRLPKKLKRHLKGRAVQSGADKLRSGQPFPLVRL
jgi:hypothetical protein